MKTPARAASPFVSISPNAEHTDIIAHSVNAFPTRTAEEFLEFLRAIHASGPGTPKPTPVETPFLGSHPAALAFVQELQPIPTSFAKESFYSVTALQIHQRRESQQLRTLPHRSHGAERAL